MITLVWHQILHTLSTPLSVLVGWVVLFLISEAAEVMRDAIPIIGFRLTLFLLFVLHAVILVSTGVLLMELISMRSA